MKLICHSRFDYFNPCGIEPRHDDIAHEIERTCMLHFVFFFNAVPFSLLSPWLIYVQYKRFEIK